VSAINVRVFAVVEFIGAETVAAAPPQQIETLRAELFKSRWKFANDQR
jgi:hypothetical protein